MPDNTPLVNVEPNEIPLNVTKKGISPFLIAVIIGLAFVLIIAGVSAYFLIPKPSQKPQVVRRVYQSSKTRLRNFNIFAQKANEYKQSIATLPISDAFIEYVRQNPTYQQGNTTIYQPPDYTKLGNEEAKLAFKELMTTELQLIV